MRQDSVKRSRKNVLDDLNKAYDSLKLGYKKITREIKGGAYKTGASEWILDNAYLLEREFKFIKKNLSKEYYLNLPVNRDESLPRIYVFASNGIKEKEVLSEENLEAFIIEEGKLTLGEIVAFPLMLRARLLIKIAKYIDKVSSLYKRDMDDSDYILNGKLEELIQRGINNLRTLDAINWEEFFCRISYIEKILLEDPSKAYKYMDEESKEFYRHRVEELSRKYNLKEWDIVDRALKICIERKDKEKNDERIHIGYYLVDVGVNELLESFSISKREKIKFSEMNFVWMQTLGTIILVLITIALSKVFEWGIDRKIDYIIGALVLLLPCSEIVNTFINYRTSKKIRLNYIPKINFKNGVCERNKTVVVVPTVVDNKEKIDFLAEKLEIAYLGNRDSNIFFAILADFKDSKRDIEALDETLNEYGKLKINELNEKYEKEKFYFLNRERVYSEGEKRYIGWERKRGKLIEFMNLLRGDNDTTFSFFSGNIEKLRGARYLITLDTDTFMKRDVAKRLIGAMAHPLNKARVLGQRVARGYTIMQPKVSISLESKNKTLFSKLFGGDSGVDGYSTAYSDTYNDRFKKGSFIGKGIIDIEGFSKVINNRFKLERVLSHDLLEGELGRCALVTDCELIDEYPKAYFQSVRRLHRWVRGDWQNIGWLFKKNFSTISRWKVFDNLRRSLLAPWILIGIWLTLIFLNNGKGVMTVLLLTFMAPFLFRITDFVVTPRNKLNGTSKSLIQVLIIISFIPYQSYIMISAILKSLYRLIFTRKNLLEWTASDIEVIDATHLYTYVKLMIASPIAGIITIFLGIIANEWVGIIPVLLGILWIVAPAIAYSISKEEEEEDVLCTEDTQYLTKIARDTFEYYRDLVNEENNYLPPDNYQEEPFKGEAKRTSPTNIGLSLMANIVAYDLSFINLEEALEKIKGTLNSMESLEKWHGHFLNWYDISTKKSLNPRYVSTVDSGNLLSYLMICKRFLSEEKIEDKNLLEVLDKFIKEMDFSALYDKKRGLFHIGYNIDEDNKDKGYYDLLASEARIASFLSIARGEVSESHWFKLKRAYTNIFTRKTLLSFGGTMFEYLMPSLIMKNFKGSVLSSTYKGVVSGQIAYGKKKKVPFGISESAYYKFDMDKNYQYKAFGVPHLGMKNDLDKELVVSPYSSIMALQFEREKSLKNLKALEDLGAYGKYGFIEAIDYTASRKNKFFEEYVVQGEERCGKLIKTYMVHHLGMSLLALDNVLNKNIMIERFHSIAEVKSAEILLKEKLRFGIINEKEIIDSEEFTIDSTVFKERIIHGDEALDKGVNILSNGSYTSMINALGGGYSKCDEDMIYRWGGDFLKEEGGVFFYIKNMKTSKIQSPTYYPLNEFGEKYDVKFSLDKSEISKIENSIESKLNIRVCVESNLEMRILKLKNLGEESLSLEITTYLEPLITSLENDLNHMTFSNLFVETEFIKGENIFIAKRKSRKESEKPKYIYMTMEIIGNGEKVSYDSIREEFIGRNKSFKNPIGLNKALENRDGVPLDPALILRKTIELEKGKEREVNLIIGYSMDKSEIVQDVRRVREERYKLANKKKYNKAMTVLLNKLSIDSDKTNIYDKILREILYVGENRRFREEYIKNIKMHQENLWAFGISGDRNIILLKVKEDRKLIRDVIKMHYYFMAKGVLVDLVIYDIEQEGYILDLKRDTDLFLDRIIGSRKNIFIFNKSNLSLEVFDFLIGISSIYIDEEKGSLEGQVRSFEKIHYLDRDIERDCKYLLHLNEDSKAENLKEEYKGETLERVEDLDFFNGYGGFNPKDNSYVIYLKDYENTPRPWINVLSNKTFGTHISESGSAYTWCGNSRENKITPLSNDYVKDTMYEGIWFRDNDTLDLFSIFKKPFDDGGEYKINHNFGYSTFQHNYKGIEGKITVLVPRSENLKIQIIRLKNKTKVKKSLSVFLYNSLAMGVSRKDNIEKIYTGIDKKFAFSKNPYRGSFKEKIAYSTILGEGKNYYTCDENEALETLEEKIEENLSFKCGGQFIPCLCTQKNIVIEEEGEIVLIGILGEEENLEDIRKKIEKYVETDKVFEELNNVKLELNNFLGNIKIKTGDKSFDYMMNGWLLYQAYNCRYLSRTAFYQSGGAYGFRDQMQDCLSIGISNPEILKTQILRNAKRQYLEGDVQHFWHPIVNSGIKTRFSDDLLWLPYGVIEYISLTGDYNILDLEEPYLLDDPLKEEEEERYGVVNNIGEEESIYNHCLKAINKALKFGSHGIPLMGSGDWNDGMNTVGNKGKGESVWLGWFLSSILDKFIPICEKRGDFKSSEKFKKKRDFIVENLEKNAWDGNWYKRAFFDDMTPLGSKENDECIIDSLPQSFSVISKLGNKERAKEAMKNACNMLVDRENGLIKVLYPPFGKGSLKPGYIKGYVEGVRENGGQYTHAATWVILALTIMGEKERAYGFYSMINPINHTSSKEKAEIYKNEPYVMSADVYAKEPYVGRGGWSYYTGAASWMYKVGLQNIVGFNIIEEKGYEIKPNLPKYLEKCEIEIKNEKYKIELIRGERNIIFINGVEFKGEYIPKGLGESKIEIYFR